MSPPSLTLFLSARLTVALAFVLVLPTPGCRGQPDKVPPDYGTVDVKLGAKSFRLWVAATERAREYGLMNRKSLPDDRGMVFVFRIEQPLEFWMRNTLIPLDLVFVDAGGKVVSIKQGKPMDEETKIRSESPARYAIELNAGAAAAAGVKVGDMVDLPPAAREPADLE